MTAFSAIREGARRAARAPRVWLAWYLATVLFALAVALPLSALLARNLKDSLWAGRMLSNFDLGWIFETIHQTGGWPITAWAPVVLLAAAGYYLLATFLAGGTIARLARPTSFWEACGYNFARLLRLASFSAVFYAVVIGISAGLDAIGDRVFRDSMQERPVAIYDWVRSALVFLLAANVNLVFDYARVRLVLDDRRGAIRAALGSFRFVKRNFSTAAGAYALTLAALAVLAAVGHAVVHAAPLVLLLLAQQAFVIARIGVKLLFYASAVVVYQGRSRTFIRLGSLP